jgi:hypothetical protein
MIVASLYGYSGASALAEEYVSNEALIAAAIMRMKNMQNVPYYITTDMNVDPAVSKILQVAINAQIAYDLVDDAFDGETPPTYSRGGITKSMEGAGTTRIDTIIGNQAAAHACKSIRYLHQDNTAFDHVPIEIALNYDKFRDEITVAEQPAKLYTNTPQVLTCKQREDLREIDEMMYAKVWERHSAEFDVAMVNKDIDACHKIWCLAAETFLWERDNPSEDLPKGCCRRGSILKKKQVPVAQKTCDVTRAPRNHFTNKIDGILGTASDIKQRIIRLKKNSARLVTRRLPMTSTIRTQST